MCFTEGMHDFDKLWSNCFDDTVRLCVFDLLELNGEDYRPKPLAERKKRLARLLARPRNGIEHVEHLEGDGSRNIRARLQAGVRRHCVEADRSVLSRRSFKELTQDQKPKAFRHDEISRGVRAGTTAVADKPRFRSCPASS
jgi:hypothetical protein